MPLAIILPPLGTLIFITLLLRIHVRYLISKWATLMKLDRSMIWNISIIAILKHHKSVVLNYTCTKRQYTENKLYQKMRLFFILMLYILQSHACMILCHYWLCLWGKGAGLYSQNDVDDCLNLSCHSFEFCHWRIVPNEMF